MAEDRGTNTDKTGGTRFSTGKPGGWWYAPLYGLRLVSQIWTAGGEKYAPLDWAEGQSFASLFDCMSRHWLAVQCFGVWAKDDGDGGTGGYHMASLVWNGLCLLTFMALERHDLDDMTPWRGVTTAMREQAQAEADLLDMDILVILRDYQKHGWPKPDLPDVSATVASGGAAMVEWASGGCNWSAYDPAVHPDFMPGSAASSMGHPHEASGVEL